MGGQATIDLFRRIVVGAKNLTDRSESNVFARPALPYNHPMQKKMFWIIFSLAGLLADFVLPFWWACAATIPILVASWWIAYRSDWF